MSQTLRLPEILELARETGKVAVEDLAAHFGVTVQTIRRDLSELAEVGQLDRVHGGAVLPSGITNLGYEERRSLNQPAKRALARACANDIPAGACVFLNIGTSTEAVARELLHHNDLMVVTNNMNVASILAPNTNCEIIMAGGVLRRADGGLVGSLTTRMIAQFKFDYAVIGCSALDQDGDVLDFDFQEVTVSQTIIAQARQTFLVADHSKFQRHAPVRITSLSKLDRFYTDLALVPPLATACKTWQTDVRLCA
ncbi:DeoR/GlpR family DNA-binding transcription regulator [Paracoccaceae bacterium]|jgi:DeoR family glycerol-3-phosphate regulon repressor|nr:DeoR/GlpR transcriptional regulator [Paracoccaceae bacterium]MBT6298829.1 DeoR/GlpR transcriptional regulator [Paracoccaceae bacterium]MDB3910189.1 DeoR/GlpR family DNA-binding transcription regulator [Paracoccaceae bacterium]MDE2631562.1 DeoR/GlpR family DNA-binding transcription regulator [Paracoccaceae bacterium]HBR61653.1 DeoR family transcriptional regulator [Paracoccaceae bacterium]|tara:strand:+ start:52 stop:813 length:762 start_codon:yes stop_codon:yes gene_type:complete